MVTEADREILAERLVVWRGPLPFDVAQAPDALLLLARQYGAGTVVLDSLKDVALDLVKDEVGSRLNYALQVTLDGGVEVLALHHQRKGQGAAKPKTLEDVYGSTWLVAGAGSVVLLWGAAGDPVVELTHLKQPAEEVGPLQVVHDHVTGTSSVHGEGVDLFDVVRTSNGLMAEGAARAVFGCESPTASQVEKARRRLDGLVKRGVAHKEAGGKDSGGRQLPARYYAVEMAR
jgi:replicative DNA helicase